MSPSIIETHLALKGLWFREYIIYPFGAVYNCYIAGVDVKIMLKGSRSVLYNMCA